MAGWTDVALTPIGSAQAETLGQWLAAHAQIDALYASPLARSRTTAEIVARWLNRVVVFDDGLREIYCGEVDGMESAEVEARYPVLWDANMRQNDPDFRWPGGESYREFRARCLSALRRIALTHPGERVAVVTHTGVITQVVGELRGQSPARWDRYRAGHCSLTEIEWTPARATVIAFDVRTPLLDGRHERDGEPQVADLSRTRARIGST